MTIADSEPVKKVRKALKDAGLANNVVELDVPMENAADTARAWIRNRVLSSRRASTPSASAWCWSWWPATTRGITGFTADCVPPVGFAHKLPTAIDRSLKRFKHFYAVAGDP